MKISQTKDVELITKLNKPIHELHRELYPEYFKPYDFQSFKPFFEDMMAKEDFIFLLLEDEGLPIGFAMIELKKYPETIFKKSYQSVYVHQLSISQHHRKKGYGTKLMEKIEEIAKENNIRKIELDYWSNNEVAKSFYKKNGYIVNRELVYKDI